MQYGTMQVSDLYRDLSLGELSNLSLANEGNGTIKEEAKPRILLYANEALLRIYSRFVIRERDVLVKQYKHITNYHLLPRFAVNAGAAMNIEPIRYIHDLPNEPFEQEVLMILAVFNSDGLKLPLNDEHQPLSVFTPQVNVLQVPVPEDGKMLNLAYQCAHEKLTNDPDSYIWVPEVLKGAFTAYIAYKVFSHMNTQESTAKAQEHMAVYDGICTELEVKNTLSTSISTSFNLFEARGFV
jgi:hypothetical protein